MQLVTERDYLRSEQYKLNGLTRTAMLYFRGQHKNKYQSNMVGSELNIYAAEEAKRSGHDVKQEVDVPGTKVDVLLDNEHAIECKAVSKLRPKVITQIRKYKGRYKHVSVLILADTRVSAHIKEQLDREGADIIRAEIDREGLLDRLLQVQRVIH